LIAVTIAYAVEPAFKEWYQAITSELTGRSSEISPCNKTRGGPHISLVFREMWDTRTLMVFACQTSTPTDGLKAVRVKVLCAYCTVSVYVAVCEIDPPVAWIVTVLVVGVGVVVLPVEVVVGAPPPPPDPDEQLPIPSSPAPIAQIAMQLSNHERMRRRSRKNANPSTTPANANGNFSLPLGPAGAATEALAVVVMVNIVVAAVEPGVTVAGANVHVAWAGSPLQANETA
jgi:hypothetical protein